VNEFRNQYKGSGLHPAKVSTTTTVNGHVSLRNVSVIITDLSLGNVTNTAMHVPANSFGLKALYLPVLTTPIGSNRFYFTGNAGTVTTNANLTRPVHW